MSSSDGCGDCALPTSVITNSFHIYHLQTGVNMGKSVHRYMAITVK